MTKVSVRSAPRQLPQRMLQAGTMSLYGFEVGQRVLVELGGQKFVGVLEECVEESDAWSCSDGCCSGYEPARFTVRLLDGRLTAAISEYEFEDV